MSDKVDIRQLSLEELTEKLVALGENHLEQSKYMNGYGKELQILAI